MFQWHLVYCRAGSRSAPLQAKGDNQIDCHKSAVSITAGLHSLSYLLSTLWDLVEFPYPCGIGQGTVAKYRSIYW